MSSTESSKSSSWRIVKRFDVGNGVGDRGDSERGRLGAGADRLPVTDMSSNDNSEVCSYVRAVPGSVVGKLAIVLTCVYDAESGNGDTSMS